MRVRTASGERFKRSAISLTLRPAASCRRKSSSCGVVQTLSDCLLSFMAGGVRRSLVS